MNGLFCGWSRALLPIGVLLIAVLSAGKLLPAAEPPTLDELILELRSLKPERRAHAAELLGRMGPSAAPAVRGLVSALSDANLAVQLEALITLEHIGPAARDAVPKLVQILEMDNEKLHSGAIAAIGAIGPDAQEAAPVLTRILKGDNEMLAVAAGSALARIVPDDSEDLGAAIPVLIKALKNPRMAIHNEAVSALGSMGRAAVPALIGLVQSQGKDSEAAWRAESALVLLGPAAAPAVPALTEALDSRNEKVVVYAAGALGAIGPAAEPAVPKLEKLLSSVNPDLRMHVASALGEIGPAASGAVDDLATALKDRDENVRRETAEALGKIGPKASSASPALLALLNDEAGSVSVHAAWALSRIGAEAVPHLIAVLKDPQQQHLAVVVLGDIGPPAKEAAGVLADLLSAPDLNPEFGREVLLALAHIGPEARPAAPELLKILKDEKHPLRAGAAWALARIGAKEANAELIKALPKQDDSPLSLVAPVALMVLNPDTDRYLPFALPRLIGMLNHKSPIVRREAAMVLAELGPKAAEAAPQLADGLRDPDPETRKQFLAVLGAIGPEAAPALPAIMQALTDQNLSVQYAAIYAIGKIGAAAQQAIPFLEKNLRERDEFLQIASAWALALVSEQPAALASQCLDPLTRALKLPDPRARDEALRALARLGPAAEPAAPAIKALANDPDENVRKSAAAALEAIGR